MATTTQEQLVAEYYTRTAPQYQSWGKYPDLPGIYALHSGYDPFCTAAPLEHKCAISCMDDMIMQWLGIIHGEPVVIADLGCGSGSLSILIGMDYPQAVVTGVTLVPCQAEAAQACIASLGLTNVTIQIGNFMHLEEIPDGSCDRVMFIESLLHASSLVDALKEAYRILKPGGMLLFQETLVKKPRLSKKDISRLETYRAGFYIPAHTTVSKFLEAMCEAGFVNTHVLDITKHVFLSAKLIGDHAQMRLQQHPDCPTEERIQREASVLLRDLMDGYLTGKNVIGYYVVRAYK